MPAIYLLGFGPPPSPQNPGYSPCTKLSQPNWGTYLDKTLPSWSLVTQPPPPPPPPTVLRLISSFKGMLIHIFLNPRKEPDRYSLAERDKGRLFFIFLSFFVYFFLAGRGRLFMGSNSRMNIIPNIIQS